MRCWSVILCHAFLSRCGIDHTYSNSLFVCAFTNSNKFYQQNSSYMKLCDWMAHTWLNIRISNFIKINHYEYYLQRVRRYNEAAFVNCSAYNIHNYMNEHVSILILYILYWDNMLIPFIWSIWYGVNLINHRDYSWFHVVYLTIILFQ